jgi:hypothetical protein
LRDCLKRVRAVHRAALTYPRAAKGHNKPLSAIAYAAAPQILVLR